MTRANILGVGISPIDMEAALNAIAGKIESNQKDFICVVPAHTVMDCLADLALCRIVNSSGIATPDGMSIVWLLRLKGYARVHRVYGPDLLLAACERGLVHSWRHYFYGGAAGVAQSLVEKLSVRLPGLQVAGMYTPPFRQHTEEEDRQVVWEINDAAADIVWVALGSPKQEYWMSEHLGKIQAPVMIGVGAAFDYISGRKRQAPDWIQRSGFEWFYRWLSEPRRLWPRYRQYPKFVLLALAQLAGVRKFPLEK